MAWCLQCGIQGKNELSVGVDEDGEEACAMHRVKSRQTTRARVSVVQPEKSKAMNEQHLCPGYGKPCTEMIGSKKELCSKCYARRFYAKSRSAATKLPKKSHHKKIEKASVATVASISDLAALKAKLLRDLEAVVAALKAKLLRDLEAVDTVLALLSKAS